MPEENEKYKNIDWLIPNIDIEDVLDRLGVRVSQKLGDEILGWCPDHHMFTRREPSHPKWSVNIYTGKTKCFTEDRGSNLLYTVARIRRCSPREAIEWMVGDGGMTDAELDGAVREAERMAKQRESQPFKTVKGLHDMAESIKSGKMTAGGYDFFMKPIGKKATLIEKETVDHYGCIEIKDGYYANRVIVPFRLRGELVGFAAIDVLGKKEWARQHPTLDPEKSYRKVLYPSGFKSGEYLFGFDDCVKGELVVCLVEGPRETMKLRQVGIRALSLQKAGISDEQIGLLAHIAPKKIVIMMDGDDAGYGAQRKIYDKLHPEPFSFVVKGNTPRGFDPKTLPVEKLQEIVLKIK